jgi:hypothetical protein
MALNAVIGWLTREVIENAMVRLLSLLDPTGIMAVVNSILALYNAIQSFVQYVRQILEVVNTVLDGLGGIARGALEQAAGFLETGLVRILPIAIGFLANQVGLSGLGRRIGEMIETVRDYVNRGIDWLINGAIQLVQGLVDVSREAISTVRSWWQESVGFRTRNGEAHTIFYEERGGQHQLMIASNPVNARVFLQSVQVSNLTPEQQQYYQEALQIADNLERTPSDAAAVHNQMGRLALIIEMIYGAGAQAQANFGTQVNPFPLIWYKKPSINYSNIHLLVPTDHVVLANGSVLTPGQEYEYNINQFTTLDVSAEFQYLDPSWAPAWAPYGYTVVSVEGVLQAVGSRDVRRIQQSMENAQQFVLPNPAAAATVEARNRHHLAVATVSHYRTLLSTINALPNMTRIVIGVAPRNHVGLNTIVGPTILSGGFRRSSRSQTVYKDILVRAGLRETSWSADHVTDLYFSGPDTFDNLWMYEANTVQADVRVDLSLLGVDVASLPTEMQQYITNPITHPNFPRNQYFIVKGFRS